MTAITDRYKYVGESQVDVMHQLWTFDISFLDLYIVVGSCKNMTIIQTTSKTEIYSEFRFLSINILCNSYVSFSNYFVYLGIRFTIMSRTQKISTSYGSYDLLMFRIPNSYYLE